MRSGATFSDNPNYAAAWVVYVNGILTPIVGWSMQQGVWQIPTFSIECFPELEMQRFGVEDRVPVQIFALDYWATDEPTFRLVVDGEIIGWRFSTSGARSISFDCIGHIHAFQQLYFFYMTNVDDIVAARSPEVLASGFSTPGLLYPYALFHQNLIASAEQIEEATPRPPNQAAATETFGDASSPGEETAMIKAPYEFVTNVIKGLISELVPNEKRSLPAMNFYARWLRKTRSYNRWVRLPILEDALTLANRVGVFPIFAAARNDQALLAMQRQTAGQIGSSGSVWNLFQQVLGLVFMEIAMIPGPPAVQVTLKPAPEGPEEGKILRPLADGAPLTSVRHSIDTAALRKRAEDIATLLRAAARGESSINPDLLHEAGIVVPPATSSSNDAATIYQTMIGPIDENAIYATLLARAQQVAAQAGDLDSTTVDPLEPIRLAQHFVKPQILFGEIPSCNVIFPSMIDGFTYSENYIRQPTRDYVNDSVMTRALRAQGANREFMIHALTVGYPEEANAIMHHKVASASDEGGGAGGSESGRNLVVWPEELYKGVVASRSELPSWFQMLRQFANGAVAPTTTTPDSNTSGTGVTTPSTGGLPVQPRTTAQSNTAADVRVPSSPLSGPVTLVPPKPFTPYQASASAEQARRGRIQTRVQSDPNWAYRWRPSAEELAAGDQQHVKYDPFPRAEQVNGRTQLSISPGIRRITAHLRSIFPGIQGLSLYGRSRPIVSQEAIDAALAAGRPRPGMLITGRLDPHQAGRAADLMIPRIRAPRGSKEWSIPNLEVGNPIAAYLMANAEVFGIQYFIWARTQWQADSRPGRKATHYTSHPTGEAAERFDHTDHIHMELTSAASQLIAPFFQAGAPVPPQPTAPVIVVSRPVPRVAPPRGALAQPGMPSAGGSSASNAGTVPNATGTTATTTTTAPAGDATTDSAEEVEGDSFAKLFELYVQYDYLKKRYSERNVAAQLRWNPYLVPGFPCMLFDSMTTRMHVVAHIQNISHSASAQGGGASIRTDVQMSFGRTLPEFINDVKHDAERFAGRVTSAPAEIIAELRIVTQDETNAEVFYQKLLYGGARPGRVPAVFRWEKAMGYARGLQVEEISIIGDSVATVEARQAAAAAARRAAAGEEPVEAEFSQEQLNVAATLFGTGTAQTASRGPVTTEESVRVGGLSSDGQQTVRTNLDPNQELAPNPNTIYSDAFDNYHIAMQLAARPSCTLEQFIRFWHGGKTVNALVATGDVAEPLTDFSYNQQRLQDVVGQRQNGTEIRGAAVRATAVFYGRIFKLRPGPGPEPTEAQRGYTSPPNVQPSAVSEGLPLNYPEARADWDSVLIRYRDKVRNRISPST